MAGNHYCLWWVGYFKSEAGQGVMTPDSSSTMTHPTACSFTVQTRLRRASTLQDPRNLPDQIAQSSPQWFSVEIATVASSLAMTGL
jgi:hypothetical protein